MIDILDNFSLSTEVFPANKVVEYQWPLENGEHFFIQEHIAQYLGITSFKRKYKDVRRRPIDGPEKDYLRELGLVTEMACDLGTLAYSLVSKWYLY